jgi:membrane protein YqaA with SNARE-associated domain
MQAVLNLLSALGARAQALAESLGAPGLMLVAFVDSSFLTLPEVADFLVVMFTIRSPDEWAYFAAMTTAGSVCGSYALYAIGRKGGEALLRRKIHERHVDRVLGWYQRFGAFVLIVPALLPPPMPFKVFVLLAGLAGVRRSRFVIAVAAGRGLRYGGEALLAKWYGDAALRFLEQNLITWLLPIAGAAAVVAVGWWVWRRRRK